MKFSEIFTLAKGVLNEEGFVCYAIERLRMNGDISNSEALDTKKVIMARIYPCYTVTEWLEHNGVPHVEGFSRNIKTEYRQRWLDELIKEFSE